jgi:glucuronoarabinoxylan endo-1,4-beta-xylanase
VVNWNELHQTMVGFGGSDKNHAALTDDQADLLFSPDKGIGLSILRVAIDTNGNYQGQYSNSTKAAARGAIIWATPWSPPAQWKDNGSTTNGGHLLAAHYIEWAKLVSGFAAKLQQNAGVPLSALSPQNESNYVTTWNSCVYTPQELVAFIKVLGPQLAALNPRPRLLAPEMASWGPLWDYTSAILADANVASMVDVFSVHQYNGVEAPKTTARPIWETEYSTFDPPVTTIDNGIAVAKAVHDAIVTGNASAWHYWWLIGRNADNEGLLNQGAVKTKRLYTVGNYSKFVRPGFVRIGTTGGPTGVQASAFRDCSGKFAFVVINTNPTDTPLGIVFNGVVGGTVTPWVTSRTLDLAAGTPVPVSGGRAAAVLPASSVTTFVGTSP